MSEIQRIEGKNFECFSLDWDTDYFGVQSNRVNLKGPVDEIGQEQILEFCDAFEFTTITNINNEGSNNLWLGTRTNAFLADLNIQYLKPVEKNLRNDDSQTYIVNNLSRNNDIEEIARNSFQYSRFFNDPWLPEKKASNIYLQWTINSFGKEDKYFVVCERKSKIAGYLLFSKHGENAIIELIAVDKNHQGQKVGKSLIDKLDVHLADTNIKNIKVGTQVNNFGAVQFYNRLGFTNVSCGSVFHLWNNNRSFKG